MFSSRIPSDLSPNRLTLARAARERRHLPVLDLTESNPTRAGILAPASLLAALGDAQAAHYAPEPRGRLSARRAVAADYERRGLSVPADHVVLSASTSEAYGFLFKILCEPGDEVLVPRPSYPLFEHLTALENVRAVPYDMHYDGVWHLRPAELAERLTPRTRALLVVAPNNPTGSLLARAELDALATMCAAHGLALISDEVFADYAIEPRADAARSALEQQRCLTVALGGLSKTVALPQIKVGWAAVAGPPLLVEAALSRLDIVADAYLSVSTPAQLALPVLLREGAMLRDQVVARVRRNHAALGAALDANAASPCTRLRVEGGWTAVLRVPAVQSDEELSLSLLDNEGVLVHPGYFYDFPREGFVTLSLLVEPQVFDEAVSRILRHIDRALSHPRADDHDMTKDVG